MSRPPLTAGLALVLAILAVSWGAILVRLCQAPSLVIAFYRLGLATVLLIPFALKTGGGAFLSAGRKRLLVVSSGLLLAVHFAAWITSLSYTTVASSVVLVSTQPLFSALFSGVYLKEKAPPRFYAGVAVALAGTAVIAGGDLSLSAGRLKGDILALAGAAAASGYFIIGRRVREEMRFFHYLTLVYGFSALFLGVAAAASGENVFKVAPSDLPWLLLMAAGPSVVGHGCFNWAVRKLPVFTVNLAAFGEPVLASLYAFLLLGEPLAASLWAGGVLVFTGILLALPRRAQGPPAA